MTHLRIEQNNIQENVSGAVIEKLYQLASSGDLDQSSNLAGNLYTPITYRAQTQYLTTQFPDLHINADSYAIPFEDPNMVTYLNSIGIGSNGMITEAQAAAATMVANSANATVTKFNELRYFTNITGSRGGWTSANSGFVRFYNWTALQEVDISNFTSLGHNSTYSWEDTFKGCSSLVTVTASNKLEKIGHQAFSDCSNLETITGLSGTIELYGNTFSGCQKLSSSSFQNCVFVLGGSGGTFFNCSTITEITLATTNTSIPKNAFYNCSNLTTINGISNCTYFGEGCFQGCTALSGIDISAATYIDKLAFQSCSSITGQLSLPNVSTLLNAAFRYCSGITSLDLSGSTITTIPESCFISCSNLQSVTLPSSVTTLGWQAFSTCSKLSSINLQNIICVGGRAFHNCAMLTGNISLPACTSIDSDYAFCLTGISGINLPVCTTLGNSTFHRCSALSSVSIPNVTSMGYLCFNQCPSLTSISLPEGLLTIGSDAFSNSGFTGYFEIPSTVTSMGNNVFDKSSGIAGYVFKGSTPPSFPDGLTNMFMTHTNGTLTRRIYVPDAAVSAYQTAFAADQNYVAAVTPISQKP